jgi:hypothetical protein
MVYYSVEAIRKGEYKKEGSPPHPRVKQEENNYFLDDVSLFF